MNSLVGKRVIELDETGIRIKSKNGGTEESFKLNIIEKIILKKEYGIPQESIKEVVDEVKGNQKKNYLILQQNNEKRKFNFEIESYYMISQLNKIIEGWSKKGYNIELE